MGTRRSTLPLLLAGLLVVAVSATGVALSWGARTDHTQQSNQVLPARAPVVPGQVRLTSSGDFTANTNAVAVFNSIAAIKPDFHLAVGDMSYGVTGQEQAWCDLVKSKVGQSFPFELVAGNHEANGQNGNINDFSACLANQLPGLVGTYGREWYVDFPQEDPLVRVVMISPNMPFPGGTWNYTVGNPHYTWTANAIDGARAADIPWVVVGMHKPCLSLGIYGCEPGADIMNLMVSKKVDLVLNGHEHLYQRTHQLGFAAGCAAITPGVFTSSCVADADNTMVKGAGTVFATVGTGGQGLRPITADDTETGYFAKSAGSTTNGTWGSLDVILTPTTMSANFVRAAGGTLTDSFTMGPAGPPANVAPVADFTSSCQSLTCSFDASGSTDSDGTITGYQWDYGDTSTGTGATSSHTYASAGEYTVTLAVTDDDGAVTTKTAVVTVGTPPPNQPPVAAYTSSCINLVCSFNGSGSYDSDGTIAGYAWNFGDSSNGSGATTSRTYAAAGTYQVRLTVTDDDGATGELITPITVTAAPPQTFIASDAFSRTVSNGFGTADVGGAWTVSGTNTQYSVGDGVGKLRIAAPGGGPGVSLNQVNAANVDVTAIISTDKAATGSGLYTYFGVRKTTAAGSYRAIVKFASTGAVQLSLSRVSAGGVDTAIQAAITIPGLTYAAGDKLNVRVQVTGASPSTLSAKVWKVGTTEPVGWQRSGTDSTAGYQTSGGLYLSTYLSSSATNAPITVTIDDLKAVAP